MDKFDLEKHFAEVNAALGIKTREAILMSPM